jgi:aspartyl protease family protein
MPTGFMPHFIALLLLFVCTTAGAADVALIGVIGDKAAVLALDGGEPKTVKVGQKWSGITVVSVERGQATVEIDGKQRVLKIGQHYRAAAAASGRQSVTLAADSRGHFVTEGAVNGNPVRFLVDTGATCSTGSPGCSARPRPFGSESTTARASAGSAAPRPAWSPSTASGSIPCGSARSSSPASKPWSSSRVSTSRCSA